MNESYESLLNLMGVNTLKHHRSYQALIRICLNSKGLKYIADFLNVRDVCYDRKG